MRKASSYINKDTIINLFTTTCLVALFAVFTQKISSQWTSTTQENTTTPKAEENNKEKECREFAEKVTLQESSWISFYFPMYHKTIGTKYGASSNKEGVTKVFETMKENNVSSSRTRLTIAPQKPQEPKHIDKYNYLWFDKNPTCNEISTFDRAQADLGYILETAHTNNISQSLVLHNFDLAKKSEGFSEIFLDNEAQKRFIQNDKELLLSVLSDYIKQWKYEIIKNIMSIEFMNEPDNAWKMHGIKKEKVLQLIQAGTTMIREVELELRKKSDQNISLPTVISSCKVENLPIFIQYVWVEENDFVDIHYYYEPFQNNIRSSQDELLSLIPPEVNIRFGELPSHNKSGENLFQKWVDISKQYCKEAGIAWCYFWYDDWEKVYDQRCFVTDRKDSREKKKNRFSVNLSDYNSIKR